MNLRSKFFYVLPMMLLLAACGDERDAEAESATALMGAFSAENGTSLQALKQRLVQQKIVNRIGMQAIEKAKKDPIHAQDVCGDLEGQLGTALGGDCNVTSCTGDGISGLEYAVSCTGISGSKTCGDKTFTVSDFSYDLSFSYTISDSALSMSFDMDMSGDVSGDLDGTFECSMGFDLTYDGSDDTSYEFDCDDANFSCKVDGKEISCSRLKKAATEMNCAS